MNRGLVCSALISVSLFAAGSGSVWGDSSYPAVVQLPDTVVIGSLHGSEEEAFSWIRDAAFDEAGNVFLIDRWRSTVRWFNPKGEFLGGLGRSGEGPGEFRIPHAVALDSSRRVHVLDQGIMRITTFENDGQGYVYSKAFRTSRRGSDLCLLGKRLFVLTPTGERLIDEYDESGKLVRSFGSLEEPTEELRRRLGPQHAEGIRPRLNQGSLVCSSTDSTLYHLPGATGVVRAFDLEGRMLWRTVLKDFHMVHWSTQDGICCRYAPDPSTNSTHTLITAFEIPGETLIVSLSELEVSNEGDADVNHEIRALRVEDGQEFRMEEVPAVIAGIIQGNTYAYVQLPFPRILIFKTPPEWAGLTGGGRN